METAQQHVAIIPTPGMGHLIPLTEFALRLVGKHNFLVTFIVPTDGSPMTTQKTFLQSLPKAIDSIYLPPVDFSDLPENVKIETRITLNMTRSVAALRDTLRQLTGSIQLAALVIDMFGTDAIDAAEEFGVPTCMFFPTNAMVLSSFLYLPELDRTFPGEFKDLPEPVKLPGCVPVLGSELIDPLQERKDDAYKWCLHNAKRFSLTKGILVNSYMDLEPGPFKGLSEEWPGIPPVYPVGPLTRNEPASEGTECLKWLDKQPPNSVVFVSFGSGGTLSRDQLTELAYGLEMSGQRFLLVVKSPHDAAANASYFSAQSIDDPVQFLPEGFLDRTNDRGFVVPSWAPQVGVLSHGSTGGFLTHCGWNSTLESIVNGVPMIAWPLYAEQKMNSVMLSTGLKVAVRVKFDEDGLVRRGAIADYVRGLFEGEEGKLLRSRVQELKDAAAKALGEDGSSTKALAEAVCTWKKGTSN
ncbi:Hydroquinone glucosyltransferase [Bertholletia excelsa]